jgi:hypothetical protein
VTKLAEEEVGERGGRPLTIFFALRLAWRKPRKVILFALAGMWEGEEISHWRGKDECYKMARADDRVWEKDSDAMMRAVVLHHARIWPSSSELQLVEPNIVMGDAVRFDG